MGGAILSVKGRWSWGCVRRTASRDGSIFSPYEDHLDESSVILEMFWFFNVWEVLAKGR